MKPILVPANATCQKDCLFMQDLLQQSCTFTTKILDLPMSLTTIFILHTPLPEIFKGYHCRTSSVSKGFFAISTIHLPQGAAQPKEAERHVI